MSVFDGERWKKRFERSGCHVFSDVRTIGDVVFTRRFFGIPTSDKGVAKMQQELPPSLSDNDFWRAVAADENDFPFGRWRKTPGSPIREDALLEVLCGDYSEDLKKRAKEELRKIGYVGSREESVFAPPIVKEISRSEVKKGSEVDPFEDWNIEEEK